MIFFSFFLVERREGTIAEIESVVIGEGSGDCQRRAIGEYDDKETEGSFDRFGGREEKSTGDFDTFIYVFTFFFF